jgi:uncharacterized membrane protein YphA (DoxX/SURF4 family)
MWPAKLGLFCLRVFTGALFVDAVYYKLWVTRIQGLGLSLLEAFEHFVQHDYEPMVRRAMHQPPEIFGLRQDWYAAFLRDVMLPGAVPDVVGPAILGFELLLGISLALGVGVRLSAFLGALLMLAFGLAKSLYFLSVTGPNWLLMFVLLFFSLAGAGRVWGLDAKLQHRWPAWIS